MLFVSGYDSAEVRETVLDDADVYEVLLVECRSDPVLIAMSLVFMWYDPHYFMLSDIERKAGRID